MIAVDCIRNVGFTFDIKDFVFSSNNFQEKKTYIIERLRFPHFSKLEVAFVIALWLNISGI